jgi:hypothetical protein
MLALLPVPVPVAVVLAVDHKQAYYVIAACSCQVWSCLRQKLGMFSQSTLE